MSVARIVPTRLPPFVGLAHNPSGCKFCRKRTLRAVDMGKAKEFVCNECDRGKAFWDGYWACLERYMEEE